MLVPDPAGTVNGNVRRIGAVDTATTGVLAHEYQHLLNASNRIALEAPVFEEVWLNEGLSHISEELLFYSAAGLGPRQNITLTQLTTAGPVNDAVNKYQIENLLRLLEYLENPEGNSPYASNDDLATRGATWQLLRYAADRSTASQQTIWRGITNSRTAGIANFTSSFGDFIPIVRDWATAQYMDDVGTQVAAVHQQPSWHFRSIMPRLVSAATPPPPYPLRTRSLVAGTPLSLTLRSGGAAYLRFGVAANATGTITPTSTGGAVPAAVSFTVVRTK
jgi:hypothetical protein